MFRRIPLLIAVVLFAGVAIYGSGWFDLTRQKLIGDWQMTIEMKESDLRQMSPTENPIAATFAQVFMRTVQADVHVSLRSDSNLAMTLSFMGNSYERTGTWRVAENDGQTVKLELRFSGSDQPTIWPVKLQDLNSFQASPPIDSKWSANKMVVFRRVQ